MGIIAQLIANAQRDRETEFERKAQEKNWEDQQQVAAARQNPRDINEFVQFAPRQFQAPNSESVFNSNWKPSQYQPGVNSFTNGDLGTGTNEDIFIPRKNNEDQRTNSVFNIPGQYVSKEDPLVSAENKAYEIGRPDLAENYTKARSAKFQNELFNYANTPEGLNALNRGELPEEIIQKYPKEAFFYTRQMQEANTKIQKEYIETVQKEANFVKEMMEGGGPETAQKALGMTKFLKNMGPLDFPEYKNGVRLVQLGDKTLGALVPQGNGNHHFVDFTKASNGEPKKAEDAEFDSFKREFRETNPDWPDWKVEQEAARKALDNKAKRSNEKATFAEGLKEAFASFKSALDKKDQGPSWKEQSDQEKLIGYKDYLATGRVPAMAWGDRSSRREFVAGYNHWRATGKLDTGTMLEQRAQLDALKGSLKNQEKGYGPLSAFVSNMDLQYKRMQGLIAEINRYDTRALNRPLKWWRGHVTNSLAEAKVKTLILDLSTEGSKVAAGATQSIKEPSTEAQKKWEDAMSGDLNGRELLEMAKMTVDVGKDRQRSWYNEIKTTRERLKFLGKSIGASAESDRMENAVVQPSKYDPIIEKHSGQYGVSSDLIKKMIQQESSYNPGAVSKKGAVGLMQLMPSTAKDMGVKNPNDPEDNIKGGIKFFSGLVKKYNGNTTMALAAFNMGPNRQNGKLLDMGSLPKETRNYLKNIVGISEKRQSPSGKVLVKLSDGTIIYD